MDDSKQEDFGGGSVGTDKTVLKKMNWHNNLKKWIDTTIEKNELTQQLKKMNWHNNFKNELTQQFQKWIDKTI